MEVKWQQWEGKTKRDAKWLAQMKKDMGDLEVAQEIECNFLGSQNTLIKGSELERLVRQKDDPIDIKNESLKIFEAPKKGHVYVMTVDVAEGQSLDYHAFSVFDITEVPYKQVAVYRDNELDPLLYPSIIHAVGMEYNEAQVLIELNNQGKQVADLLYMDLEYPNVIMTVRETTKGQKITLGYGRKMQMGVKMTQAVKSIGCSNLRSMVHNHQLDIPDFETISELSVFVAKGKSFAAQSGHHDDLAMTLVLLVGCLSNHFSRPYRY